MEIYRNKTVPPGYENIPFVRVGRGLCSNSLGDERVELFQDCADGSGCLSKMDDDKQYVLKAEVPEIVLGKERSDTPVEWVYYYWTKRDIIKATHPNGIVPYEAISHEAAGISQAFLDTISTEKCLGGADGPKE